MDKSPTVEIFSKKSRAFYFSIILFPTKLRHLSFKYGRSFKVNALVIRSARDPRKPFVSKAYSKIRARFNDWGEDFSAFVRAHRDERGREHGWLASAVSIQRSRARALNSA